MSKRIDQIRARLAAATPGPWEADEKRPRWITTAAPIEIDEADWGPEGHTMYRLGTNADDRAWRYADVTLIANAPADIAWLLAELERAQAASAGVDMLVAQAERRGAVKALRWANEVDEGAIWRGELLRQADVIENGADL